MSVVTGALGSIAPKLLQLLHDEYKLQKGVKNQVQWLSNELESIYAFIGKVADVPWDGLDEQVKVWARQVREASYHMEDVLDTFLVRVEGGEPADPTRLKRAMKNMGKVFGKAKARHDIASAIQDIKKNLEEVAERRQKYRVDEIMFKHVVGTSNIDPRLTAMYKEVAQLIGIDKSRDELLSMLMPFEPNHDAYNKKIMKKVSIVGVGGLGKTTLAKAVYDKNKSRYECGAFVSVGRELDLVKVFKDILFDLDKCKYQNIHNDGRGDVLLIRELREFLENKRYLVVVDDVWEVKTWEIIKLALVENNCGSRVITTTRKFDVAKEAGEVYKLQPLSYDNSKKLFYTRICGVDEKYHDSQLDEVSEKILKKCDGIPLAIIAMTSLLVGKRKDEWSEVYNSIGFGHNEDNRDVEDTMKILSFSYYDLPSHLRTCLLYLSKYPEDYFYIDKDSLIWMWIAEGFVHGKQGTRLFELGERYFNDLINRSLIQAVESTHDGKVLGCRVHDMVLDLMRKFSNEENFIAVLDDSAEGPSSPCIARRVAHQNRTTRHISSKAKVGEMAKVRSYTAFSCNVNSLVLLSSFKLVRVLDIVGCSFKEGCYLEHVGNLHHLRYLGLRCENNLKLPKQIGNLKLLQTLDVSGSISLPENILLLTQLVCLCCGTEVPDGIGKLTSLEELRIHGHNNMPGGFVKELGSMRELRVLEFSTDGMDESMQIDFVESLCNLQKIQHIQVLGTYADAYTPMWEAAGFPLPKPLRHFSLVIDFSKMPSCINPSRLPNLAYLTLNVATMDEQDLKVLARLPALCFLELKTESTVTASNINAGDGFFQNLRYFRTSDAMVQFEQTHEEDPSVLLHLWNECDAMPFSSGKRNSSKAMSPAAVMPNLEVLHFVVDFQALLDNSNGDCVSFGLEHLPSLRQVQGFIYCDDAYWEAAFAALRNACEVHPNHPELNMSRPVIVNMSAHQSSSSSSASHGKQNSSD